MNADFARIDSHAHLMTGLDGIRSLDAHRERTGARRMNVVSLMDPAEVNENPTILAAKAAYPDSFYIFAALDHSSHFSSGDIDCPTFAEQVDRLMEMGADGIKLLETKPDRRKLLDIPIDSDYFEGVFARLEETGLPLLWHVADPPEFWDASSLPDWAAQQGWGYDETFVQYDQLMAEVENVLARHPKLQVIFAHFFFTSQDLDRAASILDRFEGVHFDLAPGIEMLYNLSKDPKRAREFFIDHADRIVFGTDIWADLTPRQAEARAGIIMRFLETSDEFRIPDHADFLLGPPSDGVIHGIGLSPDALERIYAFNFQRLAGVDPRPLDRALACEECKRIAQERLSLEGNTREALLAAVLME